MLSQANVLAPLNTESRSSFDILAKMSFAAGDILLLDLEHALLFCKKDEEYTASPLLRHPKLPKLLKTLENQGVICVGLTSRQAIYAEATTQQLANLGLSFALIQSLLAHSTFNETDFHYQDGVLYSPGYQSKDQIISTRGKSTLSLLQALKALDEQMLKQQGLNKRTLARRLIVLDALSLNLQTIKQSLLNEKENLGIQTIETHVIQNKPLFISNSQNHTVFPENLSTLKLVEGSSGVYRLKDAQDKQYMFKAQPDLNHLQEELMADLLYQAAGCAVPDFAIVSEIPACLDKVDVPRNGVYRLAQFIASNPRQSKDLVRKELTHHFLIDALLANWDIDLNKNVVLAENNVLYRMDNSGALRYRTTRELKQHMATWSAHHVDELISLRDPQINEETTSSYAHLTQEDLKNQHKALIKCANTLFARLKQLNNILNIERIEELYSFLAARLYDLDIRLHTTTHPYAKAFESVQANEQHNSASILVISDVHAIPSVLLGKRIYQEWYSDFGGKSERKDDHLFMTASREAFEETAGKIHLSPTQLEQYPSHDLITQANNRPHTHRMFLAEQSYTPSSVFTAAVKSDRIHTQEHTDFVWVPIEALLTALETKQTVREARTKILKITYTSPETGEDKTISLFPPLATILKQAPVIDHLQKRKNHLTLACYRTRSHEQEQDTPHQAAPTRSQIRSTEHQGNEAHIKIRTLVYGDQQQEEILYPDPETEQRTLIKTMVASAPLSQEIKSNTKEKVCKTEKVMLLHEVHNTTTRPTQTIAHLQGLLTCDEINPELLVSQFFAKKMPSPMNTDTSFQNRLIQVVKAEAQHSKRAVLYHATNSYIGLFYDLISILRSTLMLENTRSLRAFDEVFAGIEDAEAFVVEQCQKQRISRQFLSNYEVDYQEKGLSCNFSLFGNYNSTTSSSIYNFYNNKSSRDVNKIILVNALAMLLNRLNIKSVNSQELIDLYDQHQQDLGAHLYQIFIAEDQVDKLCYFSNARGNYHNFEKPWQEGMQQQDQHKLSLVITALREDPHAFTKNTELQKQESLQARLYMQPRLMHDAQFVTINTYKIQENQQLLQKELSTLVQRISEELLQKKHELKYSYQGSISNQAGLISLQRKYTYVAQGEMQQMIHYSSSFRLETLYKYIELNDITTFETVLKSIPQHVDLSQEFINLSDKQDSLLIYAAQRKQIRFVKILLNSKHLTFALMTRADNEGNTILSWAAENGHLDIVQLLLDSPYCTEKFVAHADSSGYTALNRAVQEGHTDIAKALLDSKYCTSTLLTRVTNYAHNTALTLAVQRDNIDIVNTLLDNKFCSVEYLLLADSYRQTALIQAIVYNRDKCAKAILNSKHCNSKVLTHADQHGHTALIWATKCFKTKLVQDILTHPHCNSEVLWPTNNQYNKYNGYKDCALSFAAEDGDIPIAKAILTSPYCSFKSLTEFVQQNRKIMNAKTKHLIQEHLESLEWLNKEASTKHSRIHISEHCFFSVASKPSTYMPMSLCKFLGLK